jgi:hypothetical protein
MNTSTTSSSSSSSEILPKDTVLVVSKGCPTIGWDKGTIVRVDEVINSPEFGIMVRFRTPRGIRTLYAGGGNARGLNLLSFNNGDPLRNVRFKRVTTPR